MSGSGSIVSVGTRDFDINTDAVTLVGSKYQEISTNVWGAGGIKESIDGMIDNIDEFVVSIDDDLPNSEDLKGSVATLQSSINSLLNTTFHYYMAVPAPVEEITNWWPDLTAIPARPQLGDIDPNIDVTIPSANIGEPVWDNPTKPTLNLPSDPDNPPSIDYSQEPVQRPSLPAYPDPITITDVVLPNIPVLPIRQFDGTVPTMTLDVPNGFGFNKALFSSPLWDALVTRALDGIINGVTGLDPVIEDGIYSRADRRQKDSNTKMLDEIESYWASTGASMPPGGRMAALLEANSKILDMETDLNEKVAEDQARLALTNTHFMVDKGIDMERVLRDFFLAEQRLLLDAASQVAQSSIAAFNAKVTQYNAMLEKYKAQAQVFVSLIESDKIQSDIYRTQVEAKKIEVDIQGMRINLYKAQLEAREVAIKIYVAEIEAAKIKFEIERLKSEVYKSQIEAFVARVEAEKAKINMYVAEWDGEKSKADVYRAKADVFRTTMDGAKISADIQIAELEAELKVRMQEIEEYKAYLNAFATEVEIAAKRSGIDVEIFKARIAKYAEDIKEATASLDIKYKENQMLVDAAKTNMELHKSLVDVHFKGYALKSDLEKDVKLGQIQVYTQIIASLVNAFSASANTSYQGSTSLGETYSHSSGISEQWQGEL